MSRRMTMVLAALTAALVAVLVGAFALYPRVAARQITVSAQFEDAVGLYEGNGVSVLGMQVGKVTSVVGKDGYVAVEMEIDGRVDVPADVMAVTLSNSILTDRHIELTPPYRGGPKLKNGDMLTLSRTRTPVEFDRTLAMVDKLGKALHGDEQGGGPLGDLVKLGADIARGNGDDIKATLGKLSEALRVGSDKGVQSKKNIQAIVTSMAELTQAAADNDAVIREFGSNLRQLTGILADEDLGSGSTGTKLNQILAEAARLLDNHRETLKGTFGNARSVTATVVDQQRELAEILDVGPLFIDNLYNTVDPVAGALRAHAAVDKILFHSQASKEICNLMGLKQLGCATGTSRDYDPDFGLSEMLDLMQNGISGTP